MRILQISQNHFVKGGSDRMFFSTCDLLEQRGHDVARFTAADARDLPSDFSRYFPQAADFESPGLIDLARFIYSRPAARSLRQLLGDHPIDVAHLHIYYGKLTGSILGVLHEAGIPVVHTMHEYRVVSPIYSLVCDEGICEDCCGRRAWRAVPRRFNRGSLMRSLLSATEWYVGRKLQGGGRIAHYIAVSEFLRQKVIENGVPADKVTTIYNFVDAQSIPLNEQRGQYVLYFGRLERLKGVFTLLDAIAPLTDTKLLIVGSGDAEQELKQQISDRHLNHVELLDFQHGQALTDLIRGSICTVSPSQWYEPLPTTVLESFVHSRPVIGSRMGGIPEMISDGVDGYLVEAGNVEQWRDKLQVMTADPGLAVEMGLAGRKKLDEQFNSELYHSRLTALYEKVREDHASAGSGSL